MQVTFVSHPFMDYIVQGPIAFISRRGIEGEKLYELLMKRGNAIMLDHPKKKFTPLKPLTKMLDWLGNQLKMPTVEAALEHVDTFSKLLNYDPIAKVRRRGSTTVAPTIAVSGTHHAASNRRVPVCADLPQDHPAPQRHADGHPCLLREARERILRERVREDAYHHGARVCAELNHVDRTRREHDVFESNAR